MSFRTSRSTGTSETVLERVCGVGGSWMLASLIVVWIALPSAAQSRSVIATGEVVANDVNIRSGPSMNHYIVCKLQAGQRLAIVGERGEWYEVKPPAGAFSLISGEYVDTPDDKTGVVNGDNVRVRAGSSVSSSKYTVQTMLSRGAEVSIIKRNEDGFLRIVPPENATLWINRTYIEPVPEDRLRLDRARSLPEPVQEAVSEQPADRAAVTAEANPTADPGVSAAPKAAASAASASEAGYAEDSPRAGSTLDQTRLREIDADMKRELKEPCADRDLGALIKRYAQIASHTDDAVARQYAHGRITQLENMVARSEAAERLRRLDVETESARRRFLDDRTRLPRVEAFPQETFDARGELRVSSLYAGGTMPKRFRLVDPKRRFAKTIGYVEIPKGSSINGEAFLGRLVGVQAASTRRLPGGVDSVPVYIVSNLVALDSFERVP